MPKYCPSCGAKTPGDASFCMECGTKIPDEKEASDQAADDDWPGTEASDPSANEEPASAGGPTDTAAPESSGEESISTASAGEDDEEDGGGWGWLKIGLVGIVAVVGIVMLLIIALVGLLALGAPADTAETGDGAAVGPTATPTADADLTHYPDETFTVGSGDQSIEYTVTRSSRQQSVASDFSTYQADGVFIVVDLRMTNVGQESLQLSSDVFRLVDQQDREYETDSDAYAAYENNVIYEQLDPGVQKRGTLVFDVPPTEDEWRLSIRPAGIFSGADTHYVELAGR